MEWALCGFEPGSAPIASQEVLRIKQFDRFVNAKKGFSIVDGFHLLHFPLDESYVRVSWLSLNMKMSSDHQELETVLGYRSISINVFFPPLKYFLITRSCGSYSWCLKLTDNKSKSPGDTRSCYRCINTYKWSGASKNVLIVSFLDDQSF